VAEQRVAFGLPMERFAQTSSNLEAAATNLFELIRHRNLVAYPDREIRLALSHTVAVETTRGVRISKSKASHRIDVIAALSFACFAATREGQFHFEIDNAFMYRAQAHFHNLEMARTGQQPRSGPIADQDRAEDFANDLKRSSNPLRLVKSRRWGRGEY
jgi:hypothetical protein